MKRKIISLMFSMLNRIGINLSKNRKKSWKIIIGLILLYIVVFAIILASVMNRNTFQDMITPASYAGGGLIVVVGICGLLKYEKQVGRLLINMNNNIYSYPKENLIAVKYDGILNEKKIIALYFVIFTPEALGYILVSSAPVVSLLLNGRITVFIFPTWIPWEMDNLQAEVTLFLIQLTLTTLAAWYYYLTLMFFIITAIELARQFKRLMEAVTTLNYRSKIEALNLGLDGNNSAYDTIFSKNVKCCIEHHQHLIKNNDLFKPIFSVVFSCELATCTTTFALLLYCLVLEASSIQLIINLIGLATLINVNFIGRCYIGQKFMELNAKIQDTIFHNTSWYEQSKKNQQFLTIFHQQASHSFELSGISIFKASYTTFGKILKLTYTYFNVLTNFHN